MWFYVSIIFHFNTLMFNIHFYLKWTFFLIYQFISILIKDEDYSWMSVFIRPYKKAELNATIHCIQIITNTHDVTMHVKRDIVKTISYMYKLPIYRISRNFSEDLILALITNVFSSRKLSIANNTSRLNIM